MAAACIYCGCTGELNTNLTIPLDGGKKVTVFVCDTHAEDASVKSAKAAYMERQKKVDEFKAMAASLGLTITETETQTPSGLFVPKAQKMAPPPLQRASNGDIDNEIDADMIDTDMADTRRREVAGTGTVLPGFGAVEAHSSHTLSDVKEQIPQEALKGKVKQEVIQGRSGIPVAIDAKRIDGTGTTIVRVVENGGDQALQRRFKQMADATKSDRHPGFGPHGLGYEVRPCPVCRGVCTVRSGGKTIPCPKCGGEGDITFNH